MEINHSDELSHDIKLTNHVQEQKNGRGSPELPISDSKPIVNNKHEKQNHKKDVKMWNYNSTLRTLVVKEIRKPGKSK